MRRVEETGAAGVRFQPLPAGVFPKHSAADGREERDGLSAASRDSKQLVGEESHCRQPDVAKLLPHKGLAGHAIARNIKQLLSSRVGSFPPIPLF
jgi:hypothetical protein